MITNSIPKYVYALYFLEALYYFRLHVSKSKIPKSGCGTFLTFLGARLLNPDAIKRREKLMEGRYPIYVPTKEPLEAKGTDGMNFSVSLHGENLHGNADVPYFSTSEYKPPIVPL